MQSDRLYTMSESHELLIGVRLRQGLGHGLEPAAAAAGELYGKKRRLTTAGYSTWRVPTTIVILTGVRLRRWVGIGSELRRCRGRGDGRRLHGVRLRAGHCRHRRLRRDVLLQLLVALLQLRLHVVNQYPGSGLVCVLSGKASAACDAMSAPAGCRAAAVPTATQQERI